MEVKIVKQSYNPLLNRKEVQVEVEHPGAGTPDRSAIRKSLAARLNAKPECVFVVSMESRTGSHGTFCHVDVYDSPDIARKVLQPHIVERNFPSEKPKEAKEEKAPPPKPAVKPAEKPAEKAKAAEKPPEKPAQKAAASRAEKPEAEKKEEGKKPAKAKK